MPFLPFIPFQDCVDVVFEFTQQSIPWFVTMMIKAPGTVDLTVLGNLGTILDGWYTTDASPLVNTATALSVIKLTDLTTQTGPTLSIVPTTTTGSLSGSVLPAQTALVVSLYTNNRGRSFRGRNYWAGRVAADEQTVNTWTTTRVTAYEIAYLNLMTQLGSGGFNLVVGSRFFNNVRRTVGVATAVVQPTAKFAIATQRRRLS